MPSCHASADAVYVMHTVCILSVFISSKTVCFLCHALLRPLFHCGDSCQVGRKVGRTLILFQQEVSVAILLSIASILVCLLLFFNLYLPYMPSPICITVYGATPCSLLPLPSAAEAEGKFADENCCYHAWHACAAY